MTDSLLWLKIGTILFAIIGILGIICQILYYKRIEEAKEGVFPVSDPFIDDNLIWMEKRKKKDE